MTIAKILLAVDGSGHSKRATTMATEIASRFGAEITLLHVFRPTPLSLAVPDELQEYERLEHLHLTAFDVVEAAGNRILDGATTACDRAGVKTDTVTRVGDPAKLIAGEASQVDADLVVMGSRGLSDARGLLLGSVSHKVMSACDSPVLIVH